MTTKEKIKDFQERSNKALGELTEQTDWINELGHKDASVASYILDRIESTRELINDVTLRLARSQAG